MALEQKLSLKLSQRLVMTPSLQQAIKLLQMTRLELEGVLTQELVENPVLEDERLEQREDDKDTVDSVAEQEQSEVDTTEAEAMTDIDLDAYFNDYLGFNESSTAGTYEHHEAVPLENTLSREDDLYDHLLWQVHMSDLDPHARELAELIVGNLDEDGFLAASMEELRLLGAEPDEAENYRRDRERWEARSEVAAADGEGGPEGESSSDGDGSALPGEEQPEVDGPPAVPGYSEEEIAKAIEFVRTLDPPGVGCRDLRESLCYQLEQLGEGESLAYRMVDECWELLLKRQFPAIGKHFGLAVKDLEAPLRQVQALETRPGRLYNHPRTHYVEPDVAVVKVGDEYVIQLNDDGMPKLRVSRAYRQMLRQMKQEGQSDAHQYIKEKMRSALWLIKSLDQRQRTIYKVANSIVHQQSGFFERGIDHLRPMVLRDVAEDIGMHESTVSRVVSNKYIHTPRGLFPLKFFFHSGIDRDYGEDISSLTVKRKIKNYIEEEEPKRPLSDSEIMRRLNREGIKIARRTVAKYRDELQIPSSTDRKEIF